MLWKLAIYVLTLSKLWLVLARAQASFLASNITFYKPTGPLEYETYYFHLGKLIQLL